MNMRFLIGVIALIGLLGCSSVPRVHTDYDTQASFKQFKQFSFAPDTADKAEVTTLLSKRVKDAIAKQLVINGFNETSPANADFLVAYHTSYEKRVDVDTYYTTWGIRPFWWYGPSIPTTRVKEYKVGTLVVDIIAAKSKTVIWSSSAENTVNKYATPTEREQKIKAVVAAMLAQFPPR